MVMASLYMVTENSVLLLSAWLILEAAREIVLGKGDILPLFAVSSTSC